MSRGARKSLTVWDESAGTVEERFSDPRDRLTEAPSVAVGKKAERAPRAAARAPRNWASACAIVWLETETCSSRSFKRGSPKVSHHLPRAASSLGSAVFHSPGAGASAGASLKAAGTGASGLL